MAMRPMSFGSPFHLGMTIAFSGWVETWSGSVSRVMTFDKSRFRYDKSCGYSSGEKTGAESTKTCLYDFAVDRASGFSEETVINEEIIPVQLVKDGPSGLKEGSR